MGKLIARFAALILATLFIPVAVGIVFFHAAGTRLVRPESYKETLDRVNFYSRLPHVLGESLAAGLDRNLAAAAQENNPPEGLPEFLRGLTPADWEILLSTAMPAPALRTQTEGAIDQLFGYLDGSRPEPSMKVSFVELRANLAGPAMQEAYLRLLASKPERPAGTAPELLPFSFRLPEAELPAARQGFARAAVFVAEHIPAERDLLGEIVEADHSGATRAALDFLRAKAQNYSTLARWSPVLPVLMLGTVLLLAARSLRSFLLWAGIPCLIAGALGALLSLPSPETTHWLVSTFLAPQLPAGIPTQTLDMVISLLTTTMDVILSAAFRSSAWLGLSGFIAIMLAMLARPRAKA